MIEHGAKPVLIPALELAEPSSYEALDEALSRVTSSQTSADLPIAFHWLIFTSANAVQAFARRASHLRDSLTVAKVTEAPQASQAIPRLAAIGVATAQALVTAGFATSLADILIPPQAIADSLAAALLAHVTQPNGTATRFLLVRAEQARELLPDTLRAAGAAVTIAPAYRTLVPESSVAALRTLFTGSLGVEALTFTSSSSVHNLLALCETAGVTLPASALRFSIGPITSQTLREVSLPPYAEAPEASVRSLAETVMRCLRKERCDSAQNMFADEDAGSVRE